MAAYPAPSALLQLPRHDPPRPGCLCFRTRAGLTTRFQERELRQIATITNGDPIPRPLSLCIAFPQRPLLRTAAEAMGGRGGGKPDMAQGGGGEPSQVPAALTAVRESIETARGA